jgi:hypothetical protein
MIIIIYRLQLVAGIPLGIQFFLTVTFYLKSIHGCHDIITAKSVMDGIHTTPRPITRAEHVQ